MTDDLLYKGFANAHVVHQQNERKGAGHALSGLTVDLQNTRKVCRS